MCGPIAMAIPVNRTNNWTTLFGALQYNFGRIFTYAMLGAVVGAFGLSVQTFGFLQWVSIIAGIGLIIFAWRKYLQNIIPATKLSFGLHNPLSKLLGKLFISKSPLKLVALGSLNGLLPCGMVYAALLNAVLMGNIAFSSLAMVSFGIGTLPAMLAVTFVANKINAQTRLKMTRMVPYILTIVGFLIVLRGLNLNIPYISPKVSMVETTNLQGDANQQVEMSCCHKKTDCQ
jgi:sulfite exporter TauE/SafE